MRIVLFQPDIPQNAGTLIRLAACLGVGCQIVEPCGFLLGDRRLRRAGLDYLERADIRRFVSWAAFLRDRPPGRLVLLTTRAEACYCDFAYDVGDALVVGRETAGVPAEVHAAVDARVRVPMRPELRSLNVAVAAAMVLGEALRQTGGFPSAGYGGPGSSGPGSGGPGSGGPGSGGG
ncbi:MAG: tRNA (cytidine(34)-2'-O)-methyltransferase [Rhodospirillales bacterium]